MKPSCIRLEVDRTARTVERMAKSSGLGYHPKTALHIEEVDGAALILLSASANDLYPRH